MDAGTFIDEEDASSMNRTATSNQPALGVKQTGTADKTQRPEKWVPQLCWTIKQTAYRLGISERTLRELGAKHPFYAPDGSRIIIDNPKKDMPLWSEELVCLIAFARGISCQGVRNLTDDEALEVRNGMNEARRREYLAYIT